MPETPPAQSGSVGGRWTLLVDRADWAVTVDPDVSVFPQHGESLVPVVPCDDAAIGRARAALCRWSPSYFAARPHIAREVAELVLRAAGASNDCEHGYKAAGGTATCPACEAAFDDDTDERWSVPDAV